MAIYMHIEGIQGTVKANGFQNWIELSGSEFAGVNTDVRTPTGRIQNRVLSLPHFGNFKLRKRTDDSSVKLFQAAYNAKVFPKITLAHVSTGNGVKMYNQYKLTNAIISHFYEFHDEAMEFPVEELVLNYETIEKTFVPRLSDNTAGTPMIGGYNVEKAEAL